MEQNASQELFPELSFAIFPLPALQAPDTENPTGPKQRRRMG
jgi:hypothetical protein